MINKTSVFEESIRKVVKEYISQIINEEIEKAIKNVDYRIRKSADLWALEILSYYSIQENNNNLIITVQKKDNGKEN